MKRAFLPLLFLVLLAACGSDRPAQSNSVGSSKLVIDAPEDTTGPKEPDVPATTTTSLADAAGPDDQADDTGATSEASAAADALDQNCRTVADLEETEELNRWQVVNDGVMGGRSSGEAAVVESVLILTGEIVTDGGGFASVRLALDEPLGDVSSLLVRVRTDGRSYNLTVADATPGRDRRISHQGLIAAVGVGEWEEITVAFDRLEASIFGQSVDVDPFEPGAAVEVGIILADGSDGPFRFELDWIRACT